jgi:hypothetical protein
MKKSLTGVVVLLAGAFVAHSQGTVAFGNYTSFSTGSYMYVSLGSAKLGSANVLTTTTPATLSNFAAETANGDDWTVALYGASGAGVAASGLSQLDTGFQTGSTTVLNGIPVQAQLADGTSDGNVGTWYSGASGVIPGAFNGSAATVQVYAWYNDGGTITSYSAAKTAGVPTGFSNPANVTSLGGAFAGNTSPPGLPANLPTGMGNITLSAGTATVPEPSTIALGVMGASAFLLRLRKKQ